MIPGNITQAPRPPAVAKNGCPGDGGWVGLLERAATWVKRRRGGSIAHRPDHRIDDYIVGTLDAIAGKGDGADDENTDQSGDQSVFDRRCPGLRGTESSFVRSGPARAAITMPRQLPTDEL